MLYCSSVLLLLSLFEPNKYLLLLLLLLLLLRQSTFNSLRFICWVRLCCLIAQNIFVHSRIHCSCYTLLDVVTQTDVVGQEYIMSPQHRCLTACTISTKHEQRMILSLKHPSRQQSPRPDTVCYLIVHLTPGCL